MPEITIDYVRTLPTDQVEKLALAGELDHIQNQKFTLQQIVQMHNEPLLYLIEKGIVYTEKD